MITHFMFLSIAGLSGLNAAGNKLLSICQQIGFWIVCIKCIYDIIQCALKGDRHALGNTIITYIIIYGAMFFIPWALHFVEGIFK